MRPTSWHVALATSVTTHAVVLGLGAARLTVAASGMPEVTRVRPSVVAVTVAPTSAEGAHRVRPEPAPVLPEALPAVAPAEDARDPVVPVSALSAVAPRPLAPYAHMRPVFPPGPMRHRPQQVATLALADAADGARASAVGGVVALSPVDPTIASVGALGDSVPAQPVAGGNPPPRYPRVARREGWEGTVLLAVQVDTHGRAAAVHVLQSSGHDILDRAAVEAVEGWRFSPARIGGLALASAVRVPIIFRLDEAS